MLDSVLCVGILIEVMFLNCDNVSVKVFFVEIVKFVVKRYIGILNVILVGLIIRLVILSYLFFL